MNSYKFKIYFDVYGQMKTYYSWHDVAKRTEIVYDCAMGSSNKSILQRLPRFLLLETLLNPY